VQMGFKIWENVFNTCYVFNSKMVFEYSKLNLHGQIALKTG
jgi:hypothetical protein